MTRTTQSQPHEQEQDRQEVVTVSLAYAGPIQGQVTGQTAQPAARDLAAGVAKAGTYDAVFGPCANPPEPEQGQRFAVLLRAQGPQWVARVNGIPAGASPDRRTHVRLVVGRLILRFYDAQSLAETVALWRRAEQVARRIFDQPGSN